MPRVHPKHKGGKGGKSNAADAHEAERIAKEKVSGVDSMSFRHTVARTLYAQSNSHSNITHIPPQHSTVLCCFSSYERKLQ